MQKNIASTAVCVLLGIPITANSAQYFDAGGIVPQPSSMSIVAGSESASIKTEEAASVEDGTPSPEETPAPAKKEKIGLPKLNVPAEGDRILNDRYFEHTFSNGVIGYVPFEQGTKADVEGLKKLGSDTPYKDEISYYVYEFVDAQNVTSSRI